MGKRQATKQAKNKTGTEKEIPGQTKKHGNKNAFVTEKGRLLRPDVIQAMKEHGDGLPPGRMFHSILEAEYYVDVLLPRVKKGEIVDVEFQQKFVLLEGFVKFGVKSQPITYSPDFMVRYPDGRVEAHEVKGFENDRFPMKRKMFDSAYRDIPLVVVKKIIKFGGWITDKDYAAAKKQEKKNAKIINQIGER